MILEAIISLITLLFVAIGNLMPTMDTPAFLSGLAGHIATVTDLMAPLGNWVPFGPVASATAVVMLAVGVAIAVKLIRVVASFMLGGGGGAA